MSKNRTMQAKNAKAVKYSIEYTASIRNYEIQCEGIQARNNKRLGITLWNDARVNHMQERAERLAYKLTLREYPDWSPSTFTAVVDGKRVKAVFSAECDYYARAVEKVYSLLDRGMAEDMILAYWTM